LAQNEPPGRNAAYESSWVFVFVDAISTQTIGSSA
jgi:hypothetical protein